MNDQMQESRVRLVLLADHGLFLASLGRSLASEPDLELAGECGTSAEALEVLNGSTVDVVLLDFEVGMERGNDFISAARQAGYAGQFLILVGSTDVRTLATALKASVSGVFLKSETLHRLLEAIRLVRNGGIWIDQRIIQLLADQLVDRPARLGCERSNGCLEERERNVLLGIVEGLTNRKIGANLGISESCVKNVLQRLFSKTGAKTRSQLVRVALDGSLGSAPYFKPQPSRILNGAREP
jgi:two-component system nitrate/nitrite response regulator NarL